MKKLLILTSLLFITHQLAAHGANKPKQAPDSDVIVTHAEGGNILDGIYSKSGLIKFGHTPKSSLTRQWTVIHDKNMIVDIDDTSGVGMGLADNGRYVYGTKFRLNCTEPVTVIEVNFALFNIWGDYITTVKDTIIEDFEPGKQIKQDATWNSFTENGTYFASIAYVARVRTKSGRVINCKLGKVLEEGKKLYDSLTLEDLQPKKEKPSSKETP